MGITLDLIQKAKKQYMDIFMGKMGKLRRGNLIGEEEERSINTKGDGERSDK